MHQGHQVCHWLTDHTRPLFGEREMYVTVQSSFLIILRLPGVCWLEDPRGPPGGAAEQRAPCPGVQRDGTSSTSLTQAGLLDKTISTRVSLSPPSVRIEAKGTVESVTVVHDRLSTLLIYEHAFNYTCHTKCHFNFSGLKCQQVITCLQFEMTYINLTRLSFWLKRSFVAFIISLLQTGLLECHKLLTILYKM